MDYEITTEGIAGLIKARGSIACPDIGHHFGEPFWTGVIERAAAPLIESGQISIDPSKGAVWNDEFSPVSDSNETIKGETLPDSDEKQDDGKGNPCYSDFYPVVPVELKARPQWGFWKQETRNGKPTKIPYQVSGRKAQSNQPDTWTDYQAAYNHRDGFSGIGFVCSANDPYCGMGLSDCGKVLTSKCLWSKIKQFLKRKSRPPDFSEQRLQLFPGVSAPERWYKMISTENSNIHSELNQPQNENISHSVSHRSQLYEITLACGTKIPLQDLERSGLSYIPCTHEQPLFRYAHLWDSPTPINLDKFPQKAHGWAMNRMQGVQVFTGTPTKRVRNEIVDYLTVLDVEVSLLERYPDTYKQIEQVFYENIVGEAFVLQTKSGGRQFYCYVPNYHERKREFKDRDDGKMLLEFLSEKCLARLDDRYRILTGSLFDIPTLPKEALQSLYHLILPLATEHQVSNHPTQTVEKSQLGDLGIHWKENGQSQYFPMAQCQATEHRGDPSRKTVQFHKWDGGIKGHCYNCRESWWEVEPPPIPEPPDPEPIPPSIFSKTPELKTLANEVGGKLSGWTWQYPGTINGQSPEQLNRHLYNPFLNLECPDCHELVPTYVDIGCLTAGPHCPECNGGHQRKPEVISNSYLLYEQERKPDNAIISDHQGYIADDPLLQDEALWNQGGIFHLGAPMGSGKTTLIYKRAREASETDAITIVVVPRKSLAQSVHAELRTDTTLGWSLHYEGSEKRKSKSEKWKIGNHGAVCTLGVLPHLLKNVTKRHNGFIRIFIDEVDFAFSLKLSDIFKNNSQGITGVIRENIERIGIVTAGQTVMTLQIEPIAKDLGAKLTGYYMTPRPIKQTARLMVISSDDVDQPKNRLVQAVIDKTAGILSKGKRVSLFCDSRRDAAIVAKVFGDKALLWDAYHSKDPEHQELIRLKRLPDDKKVFVTTTAVDVGVSLEDKNSEVIVLRTTNPLTGAGLDSSVQQCFRNRKLPPIHFFMLRYQNALPLTPTEATGFQTEHAKQKLNPDEDVPAGLIKQLGVSGAMRTLAADQPEDFITYHLRQAGVEVQIEEVDWEKVDYQTVQQKQKLLKDFEMEVVREKALQILCPEQLLTEKEIRDLNWGDLQPAPIVQLAHELANGLMQAAGWRGKVERFVDVGNTVEADPVQAFKDAGVTDDMWQAVRAAVTVELSIDKIGGWVKGFLATHFPEAAYDEFGQTREYEVHHRSDALFVGTLVSTLLEKLPRTPAPMEDIGKALIDAAQCNFGKDRHSALMKDGSVSPAIAKKVRFLDLGRDAQPTEAHFDFVKWLIEKYYPARIAKVGDLYQLAAPTDSEQVDAFAKIMSSRIMHKHPDIAPEPQNADFTPPPAQDPKADDKALVVQMRTDGHSFRDIEKHTGTPIGTAHRWCDECLIRSTDSPPRPYIGNQWNASSVPESPQTRTPTTFEADSPNVASGRSDIGSDIRQTDQTSGQSFKAQILQLLADGEKQTASIIEWIEGKRTSIMDELKRLVDAGEIVKVKHGVYDLSTRALPVPSGDDFIKLLAEVDTHWDYQQYLDDTPPKLEDLLHGLDDGITPMPTESELRDYWGSVDVVGEGIDADILDKSGPLISVLHGQIRSDPKFVPQWIDAWMAIYVLFRGRAGPKMIAAFRALHKSYEVAKEFDSTLQHPVVIPYLRSWQRHFDPRISMEARRHALEMQDDGRIIVETNQIDEETGKKGWRILEP